MSDMHGSRVRSDVDTYCFLIYIFGLSNETADRGTLPIKLPQGRVLDGVLQPHRAPMLACVGAVPRLARDGLGSVAAYLTSV